MNRRKLLKMLIAVPVVVALPARQQLLTPGVTVGAVDVSHAYPKTKVSTPKFSFSDDGDTGIYCSSKDEIRLVVGGVDKGIVA